MYTREQQEQFQQIFKENQEKFKKYDENSIDKARNAWQDARELVQHIQSGGNSLIDIYEARQRESDARIELDDAIKYSRHLQAAKQERERLAKLDAERAEAQKQHAAEMKKEYREQAKARYLAAGGTVAQFDEAFPGIWKERLAKQTVEGKSEQETMMDSMRQSGKYY